MAILDFLLFWKKRKEGFYFNETPATLRKEGESVKLIVKQFSWIFDKQTLEESHQLLAGNFNYVFEHFKAIPGSSVSTKELEELSIKVIVENFYVNNLLRITSKSFSNMSLEFDENDLYHPTTQYDVVNYLKALYPDNYKEKARILLELDLEQFTRFEELKAEFEVTTPPVTSTGKIHAEITRIA